MNILPAGPRKTIVTGYPGHCDLVVGFIFWSMKKNERHYTMIPRYLHQYKTYVCRNQSFRKFKYAFIAYTVPERKDYPISIETKYHFDFLM